jgi:N-acetylglucosaminyl-diphospho-decaprenol L-rhamnosyltransferase
MCPNAEAGNACGASRGYRSAVRGVRRSSHVQTVGAAGLQPGVLNDDAQVQVVIVNYRTPDLTIDCLHSLKDQLAAWPGAQAAVADNASADGSVEQIRKAIAEQGWGEWAAVMPLRRNGGYAVGCNEIIRAALGSARPPSYFWLLNPDTRPQPGALVALLDHMRQHAGAGIVGSQLEDAEGRPQASAFRFPNVVNELDAALRLGIVSRLLRRWSLVLPPGDEPSPVDWVRGASMLVRRQVFQTIGLLDEGFFLYFEDVDLCRRAQDAGWECWQVPQSRVLHLHGQSPGGAGAQRWWGCIPEHWLASRRRYWRKHHSLGHAVLADACWIGGLMAWRLRRALQHRPDTDPAHFLAQSIRNLTVLRREQL